MKQLTQYKIAKYILIAGVSFWFCETLTFLIIYGWHTKLINHAEVVCDSISETTIHIGLIIFLSLLFEQSEVIAKICDRVKKK